MNERKNLVLGLILVALITVQVLGGVSAFTVNADGNQTNTDYNISGDRLNIADVAVYGEYLPGGSTCSSTNILKRNGADDWQCAADDDTTYSAGNGITLSTTTFSVAAGWGLSQSAGGLLADNTVLANNTYVDTKVESVGGSAPITSSGGTSPSIGITIAGDLVAGSGLLGGADNIIPGNDADYTFSHDPAVLPNQTYARETFLNYSDSCTSGQKYVWGTGCETDTDGTVTSVSGSAPITSSGGATPDIGITLTGDITATGGVSVTGGTNAITAGQSVVITAPLQPNINGANVTEGTILDARLSSNIMYLDGTRPLTGDWDVNTNSITGVADITAVNVNVTERVSLGDNDPVCFGDACDICQFFNGTHLRTAKPCPL